jgi:hypothetical protein
MRCPAMRLSTNFWPSGGEVTGSLKIRFSEEFIPSGGDV